MTNYCQVVRLKKTKSMKVFEIKLTVDKKPASEYVAANKNIEALKVYSATTLIDLWELDSTDEIVEVPEEEWVNHKVINTDYDPFDPFDWESRTFEEIMKVVVEPALISVTMFWDDELDELPEL